MFNTYNEGDTNLKINACSGGIYKTYKESWFEYLRLNSSRAEILFKDYENINDYIYSIRKYKDFVILQMILTANENYVIVELIRQEDFEKYFNEGDTNGNRSED